MTNQVWRGVLVSDRPLDANEGARGDVLLEMEIPSEVFEEYEWIEAEKLYRESLLPADLLNSYARPTIAAEE